MALSNLEQEILWVESWNDLDDLIEEHSEEYLLQEDHQEVTPV